MCAQLARDLFAIAKFLAIWGRVRSAEFSVSGQFF